MTVAECVIIGAYVLASAGEAVGTNMSDVERRREQNLTETYDLETAFSAAVAFVDLAVVFLDRFGLGSCGNTIEFEAHIVGYNAEICGLSRTSSMAVSSTAATAPAEWDTAALPRLEALRVARVLVDVAASAAARFLLVSKTWSASCRTAATT